MFVMYDIIICSFNEFQILIFDLPNLSEKRIDQTTGINITDQYNQSEELL